MEKSTFTEAQIANYLQQAESRTPVEKVCREKGISECYILQMEKEIWRTWREWATTSLELEEGKQ